MPFSRARRLTSAAIGALVATVFFAAGCGGSSNINNQNSGNNAGGSSAINATVVGIAAAQTTTADINVTSGSPALNVHLFGANTTGNNLSAGNSITFVHPGTNYVAFIVGDGLAANDTVAFSGSDVTVTSGTVAFAKPSGTGDGSTGLTFQFTVPLGASGQRNLQVQDPNGHISIYSGAILIE